MDHPQAWVHRVERLRRSTLVPFILAFAAVAIAGIFGALITKNAPLG